MSIGDQLLSRRAICLAALSLTGMSGSAPPPRHEGYWAGLSSRTLAVSPSGNVVAIACHNCYRAVRGDPERSLQQTLSKIHRAQRQGADIIELDVKEQAGAWYVAHDDRGADEGARLEDVLADPRLREGRQLLYIELKETAPTRASIDGLIGSIVQHGFASRGHEIALRSFNARFDNLNLVRRQLRTREFRRNAPFVRLQVLYKPAEVSDLSTARRLLQLAARRGLDAVEYCRDSRPLLPLLREARALGLGTTVWTLQRDTAERDCARLRDETDVLITASPAKACRRAVEAQTR